MSENAPVVIFCYRRKITKLIESLIENKGLNVLNYLFIRMDLNQI